MSQKLKLAIVGRPNVGKSALFNRICKRRIAIVDESEGVTRDRLQAEAVFNDFAFDVIDTGGIDPRTDDTFGGEISAQAKRAIQEADSVVMVVDGKIGISVLDQELADFLLKTQKPLTLAVNKIDDLEQEYLLHAFHKLGIKKIVPISALRGYHIPELLETAWKGFSLAQSHSSLPATKIAIIGRPNIGKSTLVNSLLNEERCVVSPIPGTTRDNIDIPFIAYEKEYLLIDTAGIRRKKTKTGIVEKKAAYRTEKAIERCDVALMMLDVREGATTQDKRILKVIEESGKGFVVLLNKWDLSKGFRMEHCKTALLQESSFLAHAPIIFISAKEGRNLNKLFPAIEAVSAARETRIPTHQLNTVLERAMQLRPPAMIRGKRLRIYYATQVATKPPTFTFFINYPELIQENYKKYLLHQLRKSYGFPGVPLIFQFKGKAPRE